GKAPALAVLVQSGLDGLPLPFDAVVLLPPDRFPGREERTVDTQLLREGRGVVRSDQPGGAGRRSPLGRWLSPDRRFLRGGRLLRAGRLVRPGRLLPRSPSVGHSGRPPVTVPDPSGVPRPYSSVAESR